MTSEWRHSLWRVRLCKLGEGSCLYPNTVIHSPQCVSIGRRVSVAEFVHIWGGGGVEIGDHVMIASHAVVTSQTHDLETELYRDSDIMKKVTIGANVWIGSHSIILPGVTIGDSAVVGAGSVVTRDVPPGALVSGSPAKVVRFLR